MDVSENNGTPKSSILIGFSIINNPFWGIPIFGSTHIYIPSGAGFLENQQYHLENVPSIWKVGTTSSWRVPWMISNEPSNEEVMWGCPAGMVGAISSDGGGDFGHQVTCGRERKHRGGFFQWIWVNCSPPFFFEPHPFHHITFHCTGFAISTKEHHLNPKINA